VAALEASPLNRVADHSPEALYSVLTPGAHIPPHTGVINVRLVVHLPLIVPADCGIRVGSETRSWEEGRCIVFDDTYEHEAWNKSGQTRVVLIFDVWNPNLTVAEREAMQAAVEALGRFNRSHRGDA
jgi:aspartate beta-hydroxylase